MAELGTAAIRGLTIKKPNGAALYRVTPVTTMRMPISESCTEEPGLNGEIIRVPINPSLQVVIKGRLEVVPCTVDMFAEAFGADYHRKPHLQHFLYQKIGADRKPQPVSLISTVHYAQTEAGASTVADDYVMKFMVNAKTGAVYVVNAHYKFSPETTVAMARALAAALTVKVGDQVGGSADLSVTAIVDGARKDEYIVSCRSKEADGIESSVQQAGYLKSRHQR